MRKKRPVGKLTGTLLAFILVAPFQPLWPRDSAGTIPDAITPADIALARKCIFSPESGEVLPPEKAALLDADHDGVVSMEDLNGLPPSRGRWKTLFVAPNPPANAQPHQPQGSYQNPFVLTEKTVASAGGFYDQIRKITFASDKGPGCNAEIVFLPGTYAGLQLLLRNADTDEVQTTLPKQPPIKAVIDRFHPVRILLRSLYPLSDDPAKQAIFFGGSEGKDEPGILKCGPALRTKSQGVNGNGPQFLLIEGDLGVPHKSPISGITVSGLNISCYRCGIDLLFASRIVLKNNRLECLGSARTPEEIAVPEKEMSVPYGTSAIGMARNCEDILIKNNRISTTWNRDLGPFSPTNPDGDLSLMHPFYIINTADAVFMDNRIENSSGPMFKVVDTVDLNPDGTMRGDYTASRRKVLINNSFVQTTDHLAGIYPSSPNVMAMIHDNSSQMHPLPAKRTYSKPSRPASNLIFLGNTWHTKVKMDFLRRESLTTSPEGKSSIPSRFPKWLFEGDVWIGFPNGPRIVERERGTPITERKDITEEVLGDPNETLRFQSNTNPYGREQSARRLGELVLGGVGVPATYGSGNAKQDQTLVDIVERGEIPGVSAEK